MKTIIISFIILLYVMQLPAQYTLTLELEESIPGGCGSLTNCQTSTICYDLFGTPSVDGAWVASYDIWFVMNGGMGNSVVYASDNTCIIFNNTDLLINPAAIRVGATTGNPGDVINGKTLLHNFCMTYATTTVLQGSTLLAGGNYLSFGSNMSVNVNNVPTDVILVPANLTFGVLNNSCLEALPVKWLSFEASKEGSTSRLTWATSEEMNNKGYEIERSRDGRVFTSIGKVSAQPVSQLINTYSFVDQHPLAGMDYYRIRQVDHDGQYSYSQVKSLNFGEQAFSSRVWPNPARDEVTISMNTASLSNARVQIVNHEGKTILRNTYEQLDDQTRIDISGLVPGLYTVLIQTESIHEIHKIVVVR